MKHIEVVCAVMHDQAGRVWIGCRKSQIADGIWEFPGGKVELDETKEAACVREIREELQLDIKVGKELLSFTDDAFDPPIHVTAFEAEILQGRLTLHVHRLGKWVYPEELTQYQFQKADEALLKTLMKNYE